MENVSIGIIIHCGSFMMNHPIDFVECFLQDFFFYFLYVDNFRIFERKKIEYFFRKFLKRYLATVIEDYMYFWPYFELVLFEIDTIRFFHTSFCQNIFGYQTFIDFRTWSPKLTRNASYAHFSNSFLYGMSVFYDRFQSRGRRSIERRLTGISGKISSIAIKTF